MMMGMKKQTQASMSIRLVILFLVTTTFSIKIVSAAWFGGPHRSITTQRPFAPNVLQSSTSNSASSSSVSAVKPTLVVGATGLVGRRIVQQLMGQNHPVRALVRNTTKAQQLFGTTTGFIYPPLEIVVGDLSRYDDATVAQQLEQAVQGCGAIISVSGALRFSKISDFLPWRLFQDDVSSWAERDHPYYTNYKAQAYLIDLAQKHGVSLFVRLTGRYSADSIVSLLFAVVGSRNNQFHYLCEEHLRNSNVPYVLLKPGGLATESRNSTITSLQVVDRTLLPPPSRVGRADVADLALLATDSKLLPSDQSFELNIRWVGEGIKPKPQGTKEEGCDTARQCLEKVAATGPRPPEMRVLPKPTSPLAIGAVVYTLLALVVKIVVSVVGVIVGVLGLGR